MKHLNTPPRHAAGTVHSAINVTILAALQSNGPMSISQLNYTLRRVDGYSDDTDCSRLTAALLKLRQRRQTHRVDTPRGTFWAFGPQPAAELPAVPVGLTPPRQVNVMHGPVYRPGAGPTLRPGALDYKAIARRGHAC